MRQTRNRTRPRAVTISASRLVMESARAAAEELDAGEIESTAQRPLTRADCPTGPCPWAGCRYNLLIDVDPESSSLKLNFPDLEFDELLATCALTVADDGPHTLEDVGHRMNVTRERMRQLEGNATRKLVEPLLVIDPDRIYVPMRERLPMTNVLDSKSAMTDARRESNQRAQAKYNAKLKAQREAELATFARWDGESAALEGKA